MVIAKLTSTPLLKENQLKRLLWDTPKKERRKKKKKKKKKRKKKKKKKKKKWKNVKRKAA